VVAASNPVKTDTLVDPNLLPPPPPRAKPKAKEIAVVCKLCGTRTYAPLDKAGQEIKCPDCHSRNVVPRPQAPAPAQAKAPGPTLDDVEDFPLSDVIERPKYRPLVVPRGDDIELASFDSAKVQSPAAAPTETRPSRVTVEPVEDEPSAEDDEVILEPPVERADLVRDPRSISPSPELEPPDPMYDGRYEGGAIGDGVDPRSPDAWKRAPLVYGILGFVFMSSAVARVVLYGLWLTLVAVLVKLSLAFLKEEGVAQAGAIATVAVFVPLAL
jgi:DNA-directed RNA polymerase subunit RPC12/RpoP